ncbi:hypothetical protein CNO14_06225 (plasmid) [Borrelia miyamotoi]|uniref:Lipoprotein n=2 Tax=Borrelia miyamotoi TaxID=47466 RepID=A0AAQ3CMW9_9SPIR|nr:hypothetical protein [Borrelia miyamotoi]MBW6183208.1 hypothetical protein [Pseudomonas aeruginosa]AHH05937.1 Fibronectin-binding lipoprotein [Borrelia miyamotoi FR64b]ATQ15553.1 hypothetical protein CNO14_06225 [Borrelia miyamotoi]ATQ16686.1 hypothetical protein CNO13_05920 [Borrelia miyamotoi]ATQ17942.1 hypothetical protein CNO12_06580 [Borrelia miyamotoi]
MKSKNKYLTLSLLLSFASCDLVFNDEMQKSKFYDKAYSILDDTEEAINTCNFSKSSQQHDNLTTSKAKRRKKRSFDDKSVLVISPYPIDNLINKENSYEDTTIKSSVADYTNLNTSSSNNSITTTTKVIKEENENEDLEDNTLQDDYYVNDALYWIKQIKENQSDIKDKILALLGDIITLKNSIPQNYQENNDTTKIKKHLENTKNKVNNIMRSSYKHDKKSLSELEKDLEEVKNFLASHLTK